MEWIGERRHGGGGSIRGEGEGKGLEEWAGKEKNKKVRRAELSTCRADVASASGPISWDQPFEAKEKQSGRRIAAGDRSLSDQLVVLTGWS